MRLPLLLAGMMLLLIQLASAGQLQRSKLPNDSARKTTSIVAALTKIAPHDPYAIMVAHYEATGGLQRWKNLTSSYASGTVIYDGLSGRFKQWECDPIQSRLEEDFGIIRQIQGDSGVRAWRLDYNGQLELLRDPETLKRRQLAQKLSVFEHLNRQSKVFSLTLEPQVKIAGQLCYSIRLDNTINRDVTHFYVAVDTLLMIASKTHQPDIEIFSHYRDYRQIDGFWLAFHCREEISPRQKQRETQLNHVVLNPEIEDSLFAVPKARPPALKFPHGGDKADVPIRLVDGAIYLPVTVNGHCDWWLLDSGASSSVIDSAYARSLNMPPVGWIKGFGYGDNFDLSLVRLPGLSVASQSADQAGKLEMATHVVMAYTGLTDDSYEPQIRGILGYDFLSRFVARIDYAQRLLTLYPDQSFDRSVVENWIDAPLKYHMFTVPVCVDGSYCGLWSVDLGAERSSFNAPYVDKYRYLQKKRAAGVEHVSKGLASYNIDRLARFTTMKVGDLQLDSPVLSLSSPVQTGSATMGELAGNLGAAQLQNFVLWLDYSRQRVALEPGDLFGCDEALDKSGMLVGMSFSQQPMVSFVARATPAENCGFIAGDVIVAIDGSPIMEYGGVRHIRQLLRAPSGKCYEFKLLRGQQNVTLKLCLEALL